LKGRVAVVTGASSGIGRAVAEAYAREGASVALADVDEKAGRAAAADIARRYPGVRAEFVRTDVSDPADCERMVQECTRRLGRLDIACNNAGIGGEANLTADYSVEGWQKVIGINLSGVFYCLKYELQHMLTAGSGAIVNLASILGAVGFAGAPAYVSAKHGVVGLTQTAAVEYGRKGIRINAIGPAFVSTPMIKSLEDDAATREMLLSKHPMGRLGKPEEVAELAVWLSSDAASFVTGSYYPVDGGYLAV
jgi:NAD(P)-dependent dehydrogenase (short-subunit alcohol dehydrogenase family)